MTQVCHQQLKLICSPKRSLECGCWRRHLKSHWQLGLGKEMIGACCVHASCEKSASVHLEWCINQCRHAATRKRAFRPWTREQCCHARQQWQTDSLPGSASEVLEVSLIEVQLRAHYKWRQPGLRRELLQESCDPCWPKFVLPELMPLPSNATDYSTPCAVFEAFCHLFAGAFGIVCTIESSHRASLHFE